ncbi:MAG: hypothetical protein GXO29_02925 [Thermotogae bacterium]|nr:hypothetical protein [Thermotogota bacterium]
MRKILPILGMLLVACGNPSSKGSSDASAGATPAPVSSPVSPKGETTPEPPQEVAVRFLQALKGGDIDAMVSMIAPEGILISPDAHVSPDKDVVLKPEEFRKAWEENRKFLWGYEPGSGRPIEMGLRDFLRKFMYDRDYLSAPKVATNEFIGKGNTQNNLKEVFPDAVFVEYHFPGTEKYDGMDWASLRVVLRKYGDGWKVVALVKDRWTP